MHRRAAIQSIQPGSSFVAKYSGFKLHSGLRMYRLATEYAEYRTLGGLVARSRYRPAGYEGRRYYNIPIPQAQQDAWHNAPKLPLGFVLNLFIALVKAVQHLNIKDIVHRDLGKADNILLGAETDATIRFHRWGLKPLVTDFGVAMPITSTFSNPEDMYEKPRSNFHTCPGANTNISTPLSRAPRRSNKRLSTRDTNSYCHLWRHLVRQFRICSRVGRKVYVETSASCR